MVLNETAGNYVIKTVPQYAVCYPARLRFLDYIAFFHAIFPKAPFSQECVGDTMQLFDETAALPYDKTSWDSGL